MNLRGVKSDKVKLLEEAGYNEQKLLTASKSDLTAISGIGEKTADVIMDAVWLIEKEKVKDRSIYYMPEVKTYSARIQRIRESQAT